MRWRMLAAMALAATALAACDPYETVDETDTGDPDTDPADTEEIPPPAPMTGMDILVMVDNSISMSAEQQILATSVFHLVNSLTAPVSGWPFPAVDDLRLAVVTSNMGFSADGVLGDEFWPSTVPAACVGKGDNGGLQGIRVDEVDLQDGVIPCAEDGYCPPGWSCAFGESDPLGLCAAPEGETEVACPDLEEGGYAESSGAGPSPELSLQIACLSMQGTIGCGFEQQLGSVVQATARDDQASFFRESAGLAIVAVSDEDDCTMADVAGMFGTDEVQHQAAGKINIACGSHPEFLHTAVEIRDALLAAKGGSPASVYFAAIVGVPTGDACEGAGDAIPTCLDQDEMQLEVEVVDSLSYYRAACERADVTKAMPGRRFVQLAAQMGRQGYVFSICRENWLPAMEAYASILAEAVETY